MDAVCATALHIRANDDDDGGNDGIDSVFTGAIDGPCGVVGERKVEAVRVLAKWQLEHGKRSVAPALHGALKRLAENAEDLRGRCNGLTMYGDHHSDIPILALGSSAVAVNPKAKLLAHAQASGWEVVRATSSGWP